MTETGTEQGKSIRRTVLILSVVALIFYMGFILMGVLRA